MTTTRTLPLATLLAATLASAFAPAFAPAYAQDSGSWLVRGRALYLDSANKDSTPLALSVNNKTFPEVDITYFFTPNLAAELVLTYPQKHDIRSAGNTIGSLKHLPPVLTLQYHFPSAGVRPYVGLGLNYTHFSSVSFAPAVVTALGPSIQKSSTGLAFNIGADVPIGGGWLLNFDLKKVKLDTDVSSRGTQVGTFKVDPTLFSVGVGTRF